ncbi:tenascin-like isoform X1 [Oncorhynchus masou masou]|uniref:tenascin-like isoform X1 n=1 Tax=Oncorhynchus masou masou TaxID=90313 RepID=UPI0031836469
MGTKSILGCVFLTLLLNLCQAGLVRKLLRDKRATLTTPGGNNVTLTSAEQPVVFNHVYNINVPSGSLCSVDLDALGSTSLEPQDAAPPSSLRTTEHTLDGQNQIVFTHRINIPQQECACTDGLPDLKDLLSRLEMLEGEVSTLRDQCASGDAGCCSIQPVTGEVGTKPYCNGHGNYSADTCGCICEPGWKGPNCTESECPNNCQDQGRCVDGKCICFEGFGRDDCSLKVCKVDCGGNGQCIGGVCVCSAGYTGEDCSKLTCPSDCNDRGVCFNGMCICNAGYQGEDCSQLACPNNCHNRGQCVNGQCVCNVGYQGEDCSELSCPNNCQDQGRCVDGKCICFEGFGRDDCSLKVCKVDCGGNGQCIGGVCVCAKGYTGEDCSQTDCLNNCLSRGRCVDGECVCEEPWTGYDCSELICPNDCYDRGRCVNGTCYCEEGFTGEDCGEKTCPSDCLGNGFCVDGQCVCSAGYTGEDCSKLTCPSDCNDRGVCFNGMCICNAGYQGEDCSQLACPNNCHNRGQCVNGQCVCNVGYQGEDCSELSCPNNCQDQGRCVDGKCICFEGFGRDDCSLKVCKVDCGGNGQCIGGVCVCAKGYTGEDCSQTDCLNNCLSRGKCVDGECVCEEPWTGYDCSELICPNDCYDRGRCVNGTCYCEEGFTGEDCGEKTCPSDCLGNGFCVDGQCVCSAGYTGEDCSKLTCPSDCNDRGVCFNGMCICNAGYQGEDCSQLACPNNCHNRGQCVNGQCVCNVGYQGEDCSELSCPNNCLNRGRCVNGQCVCDEGFGGEDCSIKICPSDCYGSGDCVDGQCVCYAGFTGEDCSELSCPNNCLNRGRCVDGQCVCDEGFTGEDCTEKHCPNDCLDRGYCVDGKCVCLEGYAGVDCSELTCPDNCNNRGHCVNGKCMCEERYMGDNCGELSCLNNCQDMGRCVNGQCLCDEGYIGEDCSEVSPPKDLTVTEVTTETVDLTWNNEMLVTEYLIAYVPTSPGGLYQEFRVPGDKTAATVSELEPGIEYLINVYAILSNKKSIPISARVATNLPEPDGLKFKSVRDTSVEVLWDQLDIPFDAWELYVRNTKEENGKILTTLPSSQTMYEQSGLGPGQEYEVSVGVIKNNTRGPQSTKIITTRIDGPRQVEVRDVTDCSGLVTWFQPVAQVDGVTVSYGPSSHPTERTSVDLSTSDKQYSFDSLSPDTEYQVSLISRRGDDTSEPVSEIFTTDLDAPKDLKPLGQTDDSVTLKWINSRADVDSYRVKYSPISGGSHGEEVFSRGPGDSTQATITGMKPGTEYGIGVTAVKNERESLPATTNAATDLDGPKDLEVSESTETSMTLVWRRPRAKITVYRLVYISRDGRREEVEVPGTATTYVLTNLTPGMLYTITLVAERGSKKSTPVTLSASTGLGAPRGIRFSEVTESSAIVHWTMPRARVDSYRIVYVPLQGGSPMTVLADGTETQALLPDMLPGVTYQVTIFSMKGLEESDPGTDTITTALDRPQGLSAVNVTDTTALLLWQPTRATVDGYIITYSADSGSPVMEHVSGNTVEFEMGSLVPATHYTVGVYAMREALKSGTTTTEFTTDVDSPRDLVASNVQTDSATLTWKPPRADITGYILTFTSSDSTVREVVLNPTATSYSMTQLSGTTDYNVRLQAIAGAQRSRHIATVFTTSGVLYRYPKDCSQALLNGDTTSGIYTIYLGGEESQPIQVYCDMTTDGGGWMVFLRRQSGQLEFFRNWKNYTGGFGDINAEFWLGLANLHKMTTAGQYELRVDLRDNGESAYAQYDKFTIAEPRSRYKIHIGGYSGTAGDSMTYHQGRPFSTYDNDNDIAVTNCALSYKGAFWYKNCHRVNLMGRYGDDSHSKGINWFHWKGHEHSIPFAEMKIRPVNFRNFESRRKRS